MVGEIKMYGGTGIDAPLGFFWCDGSRKDKSIYNNLYTVIGDKYGDSGDPSTFLLPNLQQKFPIGARNTIDMDINYNGVTVSQGGNQTMTLNQLAQHDHTWNGSVNYSPNLSTTGPNTATNNGNGVPRVQDAGSKDYNFSVTGTVGITPSTQEDILPPFTVVNFIICYQA